MDTNNNHQTEPNTADPTDGRDPYQWATSYPPKVVREIRLEGIYLFLLFLSSHLLIFSTWKGWMSTLLSLSPDESIILKQCVYYTASGLLGGVVFGIKYFYRVVARGYWHQDRRIWRIMSPLIAMTIAFIVGAMIDAGLIPTRGPTSSSASVSIGFLTGYFADRAVGKMAEIASVVFGKSALTKNGDGK